ncbi:hypothetical protein Y032_0693g1589 [Ancylostoma ceylanicum]|uniref:Uncharacterized protein n=1 Tax=Ancylostoma ceylanicum TaxID=53326 RepID=A0A016WG43_9BILA|nr:hypothetical protein Y032_0693g1589 [Ancylostoma ceylanicum]
MEVSRTTTIWPEQSRFRKQALNNTPIHVAHVSRRSDQCEHAVESLVLPPLLPLLFDINITTFSLRFFDRMQPKVNESSRLVRMQVDERSL